MTGDSMKGMEGETDAESQTDGDKERYHMVWKNLEEKSQNRSHGVFRHVSQQRDRQILQDVCRNPETKHN